MRDPGRLAHVDPLSGLLRGFDGILRDAKKAPDKDAPKGPQETPKARLKPTEADSARAQKKPTSAQVKEINVHIERARRLSRTAATREQGAKEAQLALDKVVKYYGIDASNAKSVTFDVKDATRNAHVDRDRNVLIGPIAFLDAPSLAGTVVHEVTHANQIKLHGPNEGTDMNVLWQNYYAREAMGYQAALSSAETIGLSEAKRKWYAEQVADSKARLSKDNLKLLESGQYWGMKAGNAGE